MNTRHLDLPIGVLQSPEGHYLAPGMLFPCFQVRIALSHERHTAQTFEHLSMNRGLWRPALRLIFLLSTALLLTGCTSALWQRDRFAQYRQPTVPNHLRLHYSAQRKDVLVQYNESRDEDNLIRPRAYWLEANCAQVSAGHKPRFVSAQQVYDLVPIPVTNQPPLSPAELKAIVSGDSFALYSGHEQLNAYKLPIYPGASQRVKQVLLTPLAVIVDATIIGAIIAAHFHP